ncbi:unnamed protein product, partial [Adineta steineri]
MGIHEHPPKRA